MTENPYQNPKVQESTSPDAEALKLEKDLANAIKARKLTILGLPVVGGLAAMQYSGLTSGQFLPPFFGLLVIAIGLGQLVFLSYRIKKLQAGR